MGTKISELNIQSPPDGTEYVECIIAPYSPGTNRRVTTQEIADLGGGAVDSVNGQTGAVVLDAGDIANTPAGSIAATDVQAAINELDGETLNGRAAANTTGVAISFALPQIYGSVGTPETGNITIVTTGLVQGMTQLLIHNNVSEPTYGSEITIISGEYVPNSDNFIMLMAVSTSLILVTISQEVV